MTTNYRGRLQIPLTKSHLSLFTSTRLHLLTGYERVVIGGRGPYVECLKRHLHHTHVHLPIPQMDRVTHPDRYFYREYRTNDCAQVKIYFQYKPVTYADYIPGRFYISPFDIFLEDGTPAIRSLKE